MKNKVMAGYSLLVWSKLEVWDCGVNKSGAGILN